MFQPIKSPLRLSASALLAFEFLLCPIAYGQAANNQVAENKYDIEEVIVTARRIQESSQVVPISITAISEELENPSLRNLQDLNGMAPNVQIGEDGSRGGGGANITIRGISPTRTDDNSIDSPIGVMIDDIYLGTLSGQVIENFDLERVEVLRGPQGTLFGKNTVGGVINVIRTRPTGELGGRVKATAGKDGQRELRGVLNTPIVEDRLALKLFGTLQQDNGFMTNATTGDTVAARDYKNYGASALFTPSESIEALLTVEQFKDDSQLNAFHTNYNIAPGILPAPTNPNATDYSAGFTNCTRYPETCRTDLSIPDTSENDTENKARLYTDAITLKMRADLGENLSITSITGYRDQEEYRIYDFDGSSAPYVVIERWNTYDQFSQEIRLDGSWDDFNFTSGLYY